jgi:hypothetical protein
MAVKEWKSEPLEPKTVLLDGDVSYGTDVVVEALDGGEEGREIALHIDQGNSEVETAVSLYLDAKQALILAERLRAAAWITDALSEETDAQH